MGTLLSLGDDAMLCVLRAIDNFKQDAIFVALVCTRLLASVRHALHDRETALRHALRLAPPIDARGARLATSLAGIFVSAPRIAFCKANQVALSVDWALGESEVHRSATAKKLWLRSTHERLAAAPVAIQRALRPVAMPTETLWYYVKRAPCDVLVESFVCDDFDFNLLENRALLMFAASHGRVDVLEALTQHPAAASALNSTVFSRMVLATLLGLPPTNAGVGEPHFETLSVVLLRPAILGQRTDVLNWVVETARSEARRHGLVLDEEDGPGIHFAGIRVTRARWQQVRGSQRALYHLKMAVQEAASVGYWEPFVITLHLVFDRWERLREYWVPKFLYAFLVWVLGSRFGNGELARQLVAMLEARALHLREMFNPLSSTPGFQLADLIAYGDEHGFQDPLLMRDALFEPGDASYNEWLLDQFFAFGPGPEGEGEDGRWMASTRPLELHASEQAPGLADTCRLWVRAAAPRAATELVEPCLHNASAYHRLPPEHFVYQSSRLARRAHPLAPTELEKGIAVVLECWIRHALGAPGAFVEAEWCEGMRVATAAMLPVMQRLSDEFAGDAVPGNLPKRKLLGRLVLEFIERAFGVDDAYCAEALIAHADQGYRRALFSRLEIDDAVRDWTGRCSSPPVEALEALWRCFEATDRQRALGVFL